MADQKLATKWPVTFELWRHYGKNDTGEYVQTGQKWQAFFAYDFHDDEDSGRGDYGDTPSKALENLFVNTTRGK